MPPSHFYLILAAFAAYFLCSGTTLRDRVLLYTLHHIEKSSIYEPAEQTLFEGAMTGLLLSADDDYAMYVPPSGAADYENELNNRFGGIGIRFAAEENQINPVVSYPILGSPAAAAGIRSGDKILEVNGTVTENMPIEEIKKLISRETGEPVRLTLVHFGETAPVPISVSVGIIQQDSVEGGYIDAAGHRVFRLETMPDVGYIRINAFTETTATETALALVKMSIPELDTSESVAVKSFILDLRDNPGGFVHTAAEVVRLFIEPSPQQNVIVTEKYRGGVRKRLTLRSGEVLCRLPMVVLINGETASAAEIFAAALQDYHRAKIIGSRSFGKGVVQQVFELPFELGIFQFTAASYLRPSGRNIHRLPDAKESDIWGVMPDREVKLPDEEMKTVMQWRNLCSNIVTENRSAVLAEFRNTFKEHKFKEHNEDTGSEPFFDPQLEKAIEVLRQEQH
ncbi:MAG: PDZ domain-containing protein [Planctomycetaceae bacterium]|jgi:carboxyl-terminal processing protease|nr:PDZ domain-containing protein [Planctomycetaceae bacterium]